MKHRSSFLFIQKVTIDYELKYILENDHKPSRTIPETQIQKTPPQIQWFIMFLQNYNFTVEYISWKDLVCSDTMSRPPL